MTQHLIVHATLNQHSSPGICKTEVMAYVIQFVLCLYRPRRAAASTTRSSGRPATWCSCQTGAGCPQRRPRSRPQHSRHPRRPPQPLMHHRAPARPPPSPQMQTTARPQARPTALAAASNSSSRPLVPLAPKVRDAGHSHASARAGRHIARTQCTACHLGHPATNPGSASFVPWKICASSYERK